MRAALGLAVLLAVLRGGAAQGRPRTRTVTIPIAGRPRTVRLRQHGVLQLANASYGIRPLEAAAGYQHLIYQMEEENVGTQLLGGSSSFAWAAEVSPQSWDGAVKEAVPRSPRYLEVHVILDKALYDYMGADKYVVTTKIVRLFSYVNSMFTRLNLTIVLTSLELWTEKNKIP
ncbi:hypothetical protein CIB84_014883, partial [Bambusicola thoracicus]